MKKKRMQTKKILWEFLPTDIVLRIMPPKSEGDNTIRLQVKAPFVETGKMFGLEENGKNGKFFRADSTEFMDFLKALKYTRRALINNQETIKEE